MQDTIAVRKGTGVQKDRQFTLPENFYPREFIRELQDLYHLQQEKTFREHYVYYDTFDWRLYSKSLVLCSTAQTLFSRFVQIWREIRDCVKLWG